ncbi:MAG: DUF305 domain-containing protein [Micavibrio sp.]
MKIFFQLLLVFILVGTASSLAAVEPDYAPGKPPVTNPWYAHQDEAARQADLDFITGMRPHHAGALSMSEEYLADKAASYGPLKALAKSIIHNQKFEIAMLDRVGELAGKPLVPEKAGGTEWRQIAEQGLAQKMRFVRAPIPGPFHSGAEPVSERDVQFAKAMIIHHEGALVMCDDYLKNPAVANKYLKLLCVDILRDQEQEIRLMRNITGRYDGNPDDVKIDDSMIHGMEGMNHGAHGHGAHAPDGKKTAGAAAQKPSGGKKPRPQPASSRKEAPEPHQRHH